MNDKEKPNSKNTVLVIYTGGTIGMVPDQTGALVPTKGSLSRLMRQQCQIEDDPISQQSSEQINHEMTSNILILPDTNNNKKIYYCIEEWDTPFDSSNISIKEWHNIAAQIKENYEKYRGFVILHGTDTMAYTASALSMMLEGLKKPVIITGAQIPIFDIRSDGINNVKSSILIAGTTYVHEVTLYFNNKLLRGNRSTKISSFNFTAFDSPNYESLIESGLKLNINYRSILPNSKEKDITIYELENKQIVIIYFHPEINTNIIEKMLQPPTQGAILLTFGAGNIPSNNKDLINILKDASKQNIVMVNVSQCLHGSVQPIYKTAEPLLECNVIPGYDMTIEACYAKLLYVLSRKDWDIETKYKMMKKNIRGELTEYEN